MVPLAIVIAALLAVPVSLVLLARFRRAVVAATASPAPIQRAATAQAPSGGMPVPMTDESSVSVVPPRGHWRLALAYLPAGMAYAVVMASGMWLGDEQMKGGLLQWGVLAWAYLWPMVLAAMLIAAYDFGHRLLLVAAYAAGFLAVISPTFGGTRGSAPIELLRSLVLLNLLPTVVAAMFTHRRLRTVGLLVLAFLLAMVFGAQSTVALVDRSPDALRAAAIIGKTLGMDAPAVFSGLVVAGIVGGVAACWPFLRWMGRRHAAHAFSEQSLVLDALFLIFGVLQTVGPAQDDARWYLVGLGAFAAYKVVAGVSLAKVPRPPRPCSLLLLRVFRLGVRSERLFDRLRRHWLPLGPIKMIAGPDLATTIAGPNEFLDFAAGRLRRHFIGDSVDLDGRLRGAAEIVDPDGRYRVDALFCSNEVWRDAVARLAATTDVVLMDLRSFGHGNEGCAWEIEHLLRMIPLNRVLFVIDDTTERPLIDATLRNVARNLDHKSPNHGFSSGPVRLMAIDAPNARTVGLLCARLLDTAEQWQAQLLKAPA